MYWSAELRTDFSGILHYGTVQNVVEFNLCLVYLWLVDHHTQNFINKNSKGLVMDLFQSISLFVLYGNFRGFEMTMAKGKPGK